MAQSKGRVSPEFQAVADLLAAQLTDPGAGAQLAVYHRGRLVVDLTVGAYLEPDSVTGVFSVGKGVAAIVVSLLVQDGRLDLEKPVAAYWPEFAAAGKAEVTVGQLLSHQAGLLGAASGLTVEQLIDSGRAAAILARSEPLWSPGTAFGYHGLTIGVLMEELVRRVTGRSLQSIYELEIRAPRGIDFYLGLPPESEARFRPVLPPPAVPGAAPALPAPGSFSALAFHIVPQPGGIVPDLLAANVKEVRAAGPSAFGAVGSARGLAAVYAATIDDVGGPRLLTDKTIAVVGQPRSVGHDLVLDGDASYATVFMKPRPGAEFGTAAAFGHDGMGGAVGYADPVERLAVGYVPMPMVGAGSADESALALAGTIRRCAGSAA